MRYSLVKVLLTVSPFRPSFSPHPQHASTDHRFLSPLFSQRYELLFPQLFCFHNHLRCPLVFSSRCIFPRPTHKTLPRVIVICRSLLALCFHHLAASLSTLCVLFRTPILCFQWFAASFTKSPGWGVSSELATRLPRAEPRGHSPLPMTELIRHGSLRLARARRRRLLPLLHGLARGIFRGVEADLALCGDWLALRLRFVSGVRGAGTVGLSFSGLREFGHSRSWASLLQPVWLHDHDYGRDADGAACSSGVRRGFLLEARGCGNGVLRVLVF